MEKDKIHFSLREVLTFLMYSILVYAFYLVSGVYHEKILKHQYLNELTQIRSEFREAAVFTLFPQLYGMVVGYCILLYQRRRSQEQWKVIPWRKALVCGVVVNFNMLTYNQAVIEASFPAVIMVKSCGLLSVIVVGVFCSRVKDASLKLSQRKLVIGGIVTMGILLFNYYKVAEGRDNDKPISHLSALLLLGSLLGDGFLPDFQAEIKSLYKPGTISMYYYINRATFFVALGYLVVSGRLLYCLDFMSASSELREDILIFSVLNALGQLVVYRMLILFKQHIPAFLIATRKCLTVVINIIWFGHRIVALQVVGIILVFMAVLLEVYENYKEKQQKKQEISKIDIQDIDQETLVASPSLSQGQLNAINSLCDSKQAQK